MPIEKLEEGKYYIWSGPRRGTQTWTDPMREAFSDGKVLQCIHVDDKDRTRAAFKSDNAINGTALYWGSECFKHFDEVPENLISHPETIELFLWAVRHFKPCAHYRFGGTRLTLEHLLANVDIHVNEGMKAMYDGKPHQFVRVVSVSLRGPGSDPGVVMEWDGIGIWTYTKKLLVSMLEVKDEDVNG